MLALYDMNSLQRLKIIASVKVEEAKESLAVCERHLSEVVAELAKREPPQAVQPKAQKT